MHKLLQEIFEECYEIAQAEHFFFRLDAPV